MTKYENKNKLTLYVASGSSNILAKALVNCLLTCQFHKINQGIKLNIF